MKRRVDRIRDALETAREMLLSERSAEGFWEGHLSSSALSTSTAVSALSVVSRERFEDLIVAGARWIARNQNADGGWGDTVDSPSNLATTMLAQSALILAGDDLARAKAADPAEEFLARMAGTSPRQRVESLRESYGEDRTFAVPILMNCALAGLADWKDIPSLPFELACLPLSTFRWLRLHVVSYALPALIAIGQLLHLRRPTLNPLFGWVRDDSVKPTLRRLTEIQPASGGFLEATPLTSFVTMSLAAAGRSDHPVTRRAVQFLERGVREDGSWPIDTNLSTWVTTQAVDALAISGEVPDAAPLRTWLIDQQHRTVHRYTDSPPGGWAWTPLPGGVPDADDTAGALVALAQLRGSRDAEAVTAGLRWLLELQNKDGGWPTFCRGWGKLPFDRSTPDLTAHALRAIRAWHGRFNLRKERGAVRKGVDFLRRSQAEDGSWTPLWFGNQHVADQTNPVYGTARVLKAYCELGRTHLEEAKRGAAFLTRVRNRDGSWGGAKDAPGTVEETALAVRALTAAVHDSDSVKVLLQGCNWLAKRISEGGLAEPAPIGLYFAGLWYSEKLYPAIWSVGALAAAMTHDALKGVS